MASKSSFNNSPNFKGSLMIENLPKPKQNLSSSRLSIKEEERVSEFGIHHSPLLTMKENNLPDGNIKVPKNKLRWSMCESDKENFNQSK